MIQPDETEMRHMIPRWRSINTSRLAGETSSIIAKRIPKSILDLRQITQVGLENAFKYEKLIFTNDPNIENAEELISKAILFDMEHDEVIRAAAKLINEDALSTDTLRRFSHTILFGNQDYGSSLPKLEAQIRLEIARRKKLILLNPRDSRLMGETALLHVNLGQLKKSKELLRRSLALTPNDRYLLRSSARFHIHSGDPEHAAWALEDRPITKFDPWLAAALMACKSVFGGNIDNYRANKNLDKNKNFSDRALSELRSEIATLEMVSGSARQANRWFHKSSVDPTENTIAQIEWASRQFMNEVNRFVETDFSISHEAAANKAYANAEWDLALDACENWLEYEPFSARPAILGTFIASLHNSQIQRGLLLAQKGIMANPSVSTLYNNMAVLYAYSGELQNAQNMLELAISKRGNDKTDKFVNEATQGLIKFRRGEFSNGLNNYFSALEMAIEGRQQIRCLRLLTFLCREVSHVDWEFSRKILDTILPRLN